MDTGNWNKKYIIGNIVIIIIVIWWASVLFQYTTTPIEYFQFSLVIIAQLVLMVIGWRHFTVMPEQLKLKKLVCTEPVSAVLINYVPANTLSAIAASSGDNRYTKFAVYEFEWQGYTMTATADLQYTGTVKRGIPSEILVNPNNPNEIYEPQIERSRLTRYRVNGTLFLIAGIFAFFGV